MAKYQAFIFDPSTLRPTVAECDCATEAEAINRMLDLAGRAPAELRLSDNVSEQPVLRWNGRSGRYLRSARSR